ncbi:hypothetical protein Poly30_06600 [Planctomycetes bacterium Poly30]|uniref:Uncharacterized protein n=1 Tax=Saltatorellus ferox TaxID=2528018 RepID=A0A518EM52_9BACT|nr:hypothetical protein Poly30_06600 [Planctomycetes bacterium Poly30]
MNHPETQNLVRALRSRAEQNQIGTEQGAEESRTLARSIEKTLFKRGGIGPVSSILERACRDLDATADWKSMPDGDLLKIWSDLVEKHVLDFSRSPESWLDTGATEFFRRSAVIFGVEDDRVHELMRTFHQRPKAERVAIFLPIRRSSLFDYIDREINEMVDDVEIADPAQALRSLIRLVSSDT